MRITPRSSPRSASCSRATARSSKGTDAVADDLGGLVALAGDHHHVAAGRAPSIAMPMAVRRSISSQRFVVRTQPFFTAAMMADGSSDLGLSDVTITTIGEPAGDLAHAGPLGPVPVATAPEHHDETCPAVQLPGRLEDLLEAVGGVGVVDDHQERLAGVDELEPPGRGRHRRQRAGHGVRVVAEGEAHLGRGDGVRPR